MAEDPDEAVFTASVGALNVDWTNRHTSINRPTTLATHVRADIQHLLANPSIVTVSELSSTKTGALFASGVLAHYNTTMYKVGEDYLQTLWDGSVFELANDGHNATFQSAPGRYLAVLLKHLKTKTNVLHFSVHLPHKKGKAEADRLLLRAIEEIPLANDVDYVVLGGDFNATENNLAERFPHFALALHGSDGATTQS